MALDAAHIKASCPIAYADAFAAALTAEQQATLVIGDPQLKLLEDVRKIPWLPQRESQVMHK
jgi:ribonuclease VapC